MDVIGLDVLSLNQKERLEYFLECSENDCVHQLSKTFLSDSRERRKSAAAFLADLCNASFVGHNRVLLVFDEVQKSSSECFRYRFQYLINELRASYGSYSTTLVSLVNTIIAGLQNVNERMRLRNELIGVKLLPMLDKLRLDQPHNRELQRQLDDFDELQQADDEEQLQCAPAHLDISSHVDVFYAILKQVSGSPNDFLFLNILQHLVQLDAQKQKSDVAWRLAERIVNRICLVESTEDAERIFRQYNSNILLQKFRREELLPEVHSQSKETSRNGNVEESLPINRVPSTTSADCCCICHTSEVKHALQNGHSEKRCTATATSPANSPESRFVVRPPPPPPPPLPSPAKAKPPGNASGTSTEFSLQQTAVRRETFAEQLRQRCSQTASNGEADQSAGHATNRRTNGAGRIAASLALSLGQANERSAHATDCKEDASAVVTTGTVEDLRIKFLLPQIQLPTPKAKLKTLNWSKVPVAKVAQSTNVWAQTAHFCTNLKLNFDQLEELFAIPEKEKHGWRETSNGIAEGSSGEPKLTSAGSEKKAKESSQLTLLAHKRSMAVNIFLRQFKGGIDDLLSLIVSGNSEKIGPNNLHTLMKLMPELDEIETLQSYAGEKSKLAVPEQFYLSLLKIPNYRLLIEAMLVREDCDANLDQYRSSLSLLLNAAEELRSCQALHEILYLLLLSGNYINQGNLSVGSAAGFKLSSLVRLMEAKTNKPNVSLLHFVALEAEKKDPRLLEFPEKLLRLLDPASKFSLENIRCDVLQLSQKVYKISEQMAECSEYNLRENCSFLEAASSTLKSLSESLNSVEIIRRGLALFFCEEVDKFKLEECFKLFQLFAVRFFAAAKDNNERKQQDLKQKQRKQQWPTNDESLSGSVNVQMTNMKLQTSHNYGQNGLAVSNISNGLPSFDKPNLKPTTLRSKYSTLTLDDSDFTLPYFSSKPSRKASAETEAAHGSSPRLSLVHQQSSTTETEHGRSQYSGLSDCASRRFSLESANPSGENDVPQRQTVDLLSCLEDPSNGIVRYGSLRRSSRRRSTAEASSHLPALTATSRERPTQQLLNKTTSLGDTDKQSTSAVASAHAGLSEQQSLRQAERCEVNSLRPWRERILELMEGESEGNHAAGPIWTSSSFSSSRGLAQMPMMATKQRTALDEQTFSPKSRVDKSLVNGNSDAAPSVRIVGRRSRWSTNGPNPILTEACESAVLAEEEALREDIQQNDAGSRKGDISIAAAKRADVGEGESKTTVIVDDASNMQRYEARSMPICDSGSEAYFRPISPDAQATKTRRDSFNEAWSAHHVAATHGEVHQEQASGVNFPGFQSDVYSGTVDPHLTSSPTAENTTDEGIETSESNFSTASTDSSHSVRTHDGDRAKVITVYESILEESASRPLKDPIISFNGAQDHQPVLPKQTLKNGGKPVGSSYLQNTKASMSRNCSAGARPVLPSNMQELKLLETQKGLCGTLTKEQNAGGLRAEEKRTVQSQNNSAKRSNSSVLASTALATKQANRSSDQEPTQQRKSVVKPTPNFSTTKAALTTESGQRLGKYSAAQHSAKAASVDANPQNLSEKVASARSNHVASSATLSAACSGFKPASRRAPGASGCSQTTGQKTGPQTRAVENNSSKKPLQEKFDADSGNGNDSGKLKSNVVRHNAVVLKAKPGVKVWR